MPTIHDPLAEVLANDSRYTRQAYHFLHDALGYTVHMLGLDRPDVENRHVSGQLLLEGIRRLGLERFGYLAKTVFESWGVTRTEDWGEIVFNMVDGGLMHKTEQDSREDFANGYDFTEAFETAYFRDRLYLDEDEVYEASSTLTQSTLHEVQERLEESANGDSTADEDEDAQDGPGRDDNEPNANGGTNAP